MQSNLSVDERQFAISLHSISDICIVPDSVND